MAVLEIVHEIQGPWSLTTSKRFWEGFAPNALSEQKPADDIRAAFLCDTDWQRVDAVITQDGPAARIEVAGDDDLHAAAAQVLRFISLDIDGRGWPQVGDRDEVIADAQRQLPGFRPCGFFSPYEAAVWSVLSQRVQMTQAAGLQRRLTREFGDRGAFPEPAVLLEAALDLPGRKAEYVRAVAEAALEGRLSGEHLRALDPAEAMRQVQTILGLGPFAAELVVIRGANFADVLPHNESRLNDEISRTYGTERSIDEITTAWHPFRSWAGVHLRALRGLRQAAASRSGR